MIRDSLVRQEWESETETAGTITIVYNHHARELSGILTDLQHKSCQAIISTMHIHLDEHNCMEVLAVKGKGSELRKMSDQLIGTKGVKHGSLSLAITGRDLK